MEIVQNELTACFDTFVSRYLERAPHLLFEIYSKNVYKRAFLKMAAISLACFFN